MSGNGKKGLKASDGNILFNNCKKVLKGAIRPRSHVFISIPFLAAFVRYH